MKAPAAENKLIIAPGFTWELLCIVVVFLSALGATAVALIQIVNRTEHLPLLLTAVVLLALTLKLTPVLANKYRERQRRALQTAEAVMKADPRPPVLYLRSFKDDKKIARAIGFYSIEQEMKTVLFDIGPFVALAEPNKEGPEDPGAARMRLPQDSWREKVSEEMSKAALVILRIGDSDGFWWETREASKRVKPERLLLLIPAEDEELYDYFRRKASEWLPRPLPEYQRSKWRLNAHGGVVYFEPDWTPHLQKFKMVWVRQTFWNLFGAMLKIGLRPVYEQMRVEWTKPRVQLIQLLYLLVLLLWSLLAVYLTYAIFNDVVALARWLAK